ncbi:MAG: hypothetical protein SVX38_03940, partial [Chloroflexota bacterium]|nr:hypothetical protein [Chloroflexota bacterium]
AYAYAHAYADTYANANAHANANAYAYAYVAAGWSFTWRGATIESLRCSCFSAWRRRRPSSPTPTSISSS